MVVWWCDGVVAWWCSGVVDGGAHAHDSNLGSMRQARAGCGDRDPPPPHPLTPPPITPKTPKTPAHNIHHTPHNTQHTTHQKITINRDRTRLVLNCGSVMMFQAS